MMKEKLRKIKAYIAQFHAQIILVVIVLPILDLFLPFCITQKEYFFSYLLDEQTDGFTEDSLKNLSTTNDSEIALIISRPPINSKKNWVNFIVFSTNPFAHFELKNLELIYNGKTKKFTQNFKLDWEPQNKQYELQGQIIDGYELRFFGNHERNYKINVQNIFNKGNTKIGDKFDVKIQVDYSLDGKMYSKILDYEVECVEAPQYPPNWFMFLFPGAY